jgi:hypothetical protein
VGKRGCWEVTYCCGTAGGGGVEYCESWNELEGTNDCGWWNDDGDGGCRGGIKDGGPGVGVGAGANPG